MRSLLPLLASILLACGSDPPASNNGTSPSTVKGTIGGTELVPTSLTARAQKGYVHGEVDVPAIDLLFTSAPNACGDAKDDRFRAGETYVAVHNVRAAIGTDHVSDAEVFTVHPDCKPGTRLDKGEGEGMATSANGTDVTVTLTRLDADRIEGTISAKFEDLSTFEGSFSVAPCPGTGGFGNSPVCVE